MVEKKKTYKYFNDNMIYSRQPKEPFKNYKGKPIIKHGVKYYPQPKPRTFGRKVKHFFRRKCAFCGRMFTPIGKEDWCSYCAGDKKTKFLTGKKARPNTWSSGAAAGIGGAV